MARVALLDVNVLVALFDPDHVHHDLAHDWFAEYRGAGWATCPITENGFVRVSNPRYRSDAARPGVLIEQLRKFCESPDHRFWPATVSLRNRELFAVDAARGHRQITDLYLLGLARKMEGALATFDRTIPIAAVKGCRSDHLAVIAAEAE